MEFKRLRMFALRFLSFFHKINIVCNFNSYQKIKFYATKSYTIAKLVYTFYASFMHTKELLPYTLINSNFSKFLQLNGIMILLLHYYTVILYTIFSRN